MSKKQQSVAEAQKIVADLEGRRDALIERDAALAEERSELAFAALSRDDGKARTRLDTINRTALANASGIRSVGELEFLLEFATRPCPAGTSR